MPQPRSMGGWKCTQLLLFHLANVVTGEAGRVWAKVDLLSPNRPIDPREGRALRTHSQANQNITLALYQRQMHDLPDNRVSVTCHGDITDVSGLYFAAFNGARTAAKLLGLPLNEVIPMVLTTAGNQTAELQDAVRNRSTGAILTLNDLVGLRDLCLEPLEEGHHALNSRL
ncbi:hypothetical protein BDK51DRAFT_49198 [Blyttiomyces helicus]|uniref:Uncharacterized protein n=1 Tax=Blyttiomyces helicus TaxID=388810 RepID=A0A4P9VX52_9FUNG|nr:hypothetical protein BDK51DRAFT_49198 [Blyttiomyces helicus]|eukprot:RKO84299.1 hypothetical protein BDK51DRAFT_49198 [Blyttiomyces helicus]